MDLKDKVIVITGGSKGFGKALAQAFAREGSRVVIASHNQEHLESAAEELGVNSYLADMTVYDDIKKLGEYVIGKYGVINMWINNAGVLFMSPMEETDRKRSHDLFEVNFFGYLYGCQVALSHMRHQESGVIVNIISTSGLEGKTELSVYCASKFAVRGLTETMRVELKDSGIEVYAVFPGGMKTDLHKEKHPADYPDYMQVETVAEKVIANLKADKPEMDLVIRRPSVSRK